jgi:hypothetical protein
LPLRRMPLWAASTSAESAAIRPVALRSAARRRSRGRSLVGTASLGSVPRQRYCLLGLIWRDRSGCAPGNSRGRCHWCAHRVDDLVAAGVREILGNPSSDKCGEGASEPLSEHFAGTAKSTICLGSDRRRDLLRHCELAVSAHCPKDYGYGRWSLPDSVGAIDWLFHWEVLD